MSGVIIPYHPRRHQAEIHAAWRRFNVLVCHRRFGKTVCFINHLLRCTMLCQLERPRFHYLAPLYKQAKAVAWDYLKHYSRPIPGHEVNEAELRVDYPNGGRITLVGADNPDALRGMYSDGAVLDEYGLMSPRTWGEVIRPMLADRQGWAAFGGTPAGHNQFFDIYDFARLAMEKGDPTWFAAMYKASETGIIPEEELRLARLTMTPDEYAQEFECSFQAAIKGAYYGREINKLDARGQICRVPYDRSVAVETWWDLGIGDPTSIWFAQRVGKEVHLIDYYENSGEPLNHYFGVLQKKAMEEGYIYGDHVLPHDAEARELQTGKSRKAVFQEHNIDPIIIPLHRVEDRIEAVRNLIPLCWFDRERTAYGLEALRQYRKEWDERGRTWKNRPYHDWTSHGADAFGCGAMHAPAGDIMKKIEYPDLGIV